MKKVLVGAMALLALAACSNEEVLDQNQVRNEIGFTAVTGKATSRAEEGYCNANLPDNIKVWASYTTDELSYKQYFSDETYNKPGSGTIYTSTLAHYWPSGKLSFYASVNAPTDVPNKPTWNASYTNLEIADFTVETNPHNQKDFIYALAANQSKPSLGAATALNFRHGLSQVVFNAQSENKNIYVEIYGVSVKNVKGNGKFTFPTTSTTENFKDHTGTGNNTKTGWGSWDYTAATTKSFATNGGTDFAAGIKLIGNSTKVDVTTSAAEYNDETMYLIPQTFGTAAEDTKLWKSTDTGKPSESTKAYLVLTCKIWNVATPDLAAADGKGGKTDSDVYLYGSASGPANIAVALPDVDWEQGKKYIYTFKFTETGNGGYEEDTDGPTPVFTPITLSVSVDDFAKGEDKDVPMAKE